jgi:hypothetical protein
MRLRCRQALGRRWLPGPCDDSDVVFLKWREASWKLLTYGFLTVFGICSCAGEPWLTDTSLLWRGWPYAQAHSAPLRFWYAAEFGLYAYGLVDLLVWEAARGDYYAMILHHVSTLGLLGGSFAYGCVQRGIACRYAQGDEAAHASRWRDAPADAYAAAQFPAHRCHRDDDQRLCGSLV